MRTCGYCTAPAHVHPDAVTCGGSDCKRAHQAARTKAWLNGYAEKHGTRYEDRYPDRKGRRRKSNAICADCGIPVGHGRTSETKCRRCHHPRMTRVDRARAQLERAAAGTAGTRVWSAGRCWRCGIEFLGLFNARHCSVKCRAADKSATRRALQRGCKVTPGRRYAVHERDNWNCRICGDPVDRAARVPGLSAPVIDHVIPLAQGGAHGPENWQTAHFYCNSVKRDQLNFDFAGVAA